MKDIIQKRLEKYQSMSPEDELNALKEITQEVVLYSLYKVGFFKNVCFLGGSSLRILYGLDRFSEDLDFSLWQADDNFNLENFLDKTLGPLKTYGYEFAINKKDLDDKAVQSRFIKDDSIKKVLTFKYAQDSRTTIKIKVEIDTHPPAGATKTAKYVDFPMDFPVAAYDLSSCMSGKLHALLCRPYAKGRDWYDFLWYLAKGITPNMTFLENALFQMGPWKGKKIEFDHRFIKEVIEEKIASIDWEMTKKDVRKFLKLERVETLDFWSADFFKQKYRDSVARGGEILYMKGKIDH